MHKFFFILFIFFLLNLLVVFVVVFVTCARKSLLLEMNGEKGIIIYMFHYILQLLNVLILLKTTLINVSFFSYCYFFLYFIRLCLIICIFRCGCECSILNECFISFYSNQTRKEI